MAVERLDLSYNIFVYIKINQLDQSPEFLG